MSRQARFLILRGGAIGDFILTLPAIQALREEWPDSYIELIGYPHIANLALACGLVDHVDSLDRAGMARFFATTPSLEERQARHIASFDVVVSYLHDPGGLVQTNLKSAGARQVVYGSPIVETGHAIDHLVKPLEELAIFASGRNPRIDLPETGRKAAAKWLEDRNLVARRLVVIHPGSGSPAKNWDASRFAKLAMQLKEDGRGIVFIKGEADDQPMSVVRAAVPDAPVIENRTLVEVAAIVSHCSCFIGNDSGITHLAAALGVRTIAVFGRSDPEKWGPRGPNVRIVRAPEGDLGALTVDVVRGQL